MAARDARLDRLVIGFRCSTSWEAMAGEGACRLCAACRRQVLDLAQLTPREIRAHLDASRGRMCARLTRRDGRRLVVAPTPRLAAGPAAQAPRRSSALAATLVGAWLSAGVAEALPPATATSLIAAGDAERGPARRRQGASASAGAALRGRVTDEAGHFLPGVTVVLRNTLDGQAQAKATGPQGEFGFTALAAGVYELEAALAGFVVEEVRPFTLRAGDQAQADLTAVPSFEEITVGALAVAPQQLRHAYAASDLVVLATLDRSVVVGRDGALIEVVTDLRVESRVKGALAGRHVLYRHTEYSDGDASDDWRADFAPGTPVLAFLAPSEGEAPPAGGPLFESVDEAFGVKRLDPAERRAYLARLDELARLARRAERRVGFDPAELADWLVGTAEDPLTRGEATGELLAAVEALREVAATAGTPLDEAAADLRGVVERFRAEGGRLSEEPEPEVLAAFLSEGHRGRLGSALRATDRLAEADRALFDVVRAWDEEGAMRWLARRLRGDVAEAEAEEAAWWLGWLAEDLGDAALIALTEAARDRESEIEALWPGDDSEETARLRQERLAEVRRGLFHEVAALLAGAG